MKEISEISNLDIGERDLDIQELLGTSFNISDQYSVL